MTFTKDEREAFEALKAAMERYGFGPDDLSQDVRRRYLQWLRERN